ncbi:MAG TPA: dipeptidase [Candidatus Anammoximicrobium sp.]|nr:dipeptidase [Candidatus Anammoximicrobium sp.]
MQWIRKACRRGLVLGLLWWMVGFGHVLGAECAGQTADDESLVAKARQIHTMALTLDTHVDIAGPHYATPQLDPGIDHPQLKCDLVKMVAGGVDGVFLAAYVGQQARDADGYRRAHQAVMELISAIRRLPAMYPARCALATTPDEVERIAATGKRAIMIGIENGYALGTDLANVGRFRDLGVRYITLCHNGHNQICDSCNPAAKLGDGEAEHHGLSPFGRQVVAEMNRLGIMIDLSHAAESTFRDVVAVSKAPIIASHSGCSALNSHPRNLTDEQLKLLRANGGVIQIVAVGGFLKTPSPERKKAIADLAKSIGVSERNFAAATKQQQERFQQEMAKLDRRHPPASLQDFVDHIDHAVAVAGIDHVGVGSDFDGGGGVPGFQNHADALNVTIELLRRGYTAEQIQKIWGGNLLRVWRKVQAAEDHSASVSINRAIASRVWSNPSGSRLK